jgi:hypothetical protein
MTRALGIAAVALALLSPSAALAKKICVLDGSASPSYWIFPKVKKLKPGQPVSLEGIYLRSSSPVSGTAYMDFTGAVRIGVLVHSMAPFDPAGNNFSLNILGDKDFTGTGYYDVDGDYVADAAATWTAVDCAEALNPT